MANSRLVTGAHVVLYINNAPYAWVTMFRFNAATPHNEIRGVDSPEAFELAPTITSCSGSMSLLRTIRGGGAEGAGLTGTFGELPRQKYISLALVERLSDTTLFKSDRVVVLDQAWDAPIKGYMTGTVSFRAIEFTNEVTRRES